MLQTDAFFQLQFRISNTIIVYLLAEAKFTAQSIFINSILLAFKPFRSHTYNIHIYIYLARLSICCHAESLDHVELNIKIARCATSNFQ